jgi:CheY-like chemotaxis protein
MRLFKSFLRLSAVRGLCSADENSRLGQGRESTAPSIRMQAERTGQTILVVDDDPPILYCVRRILEQAGYFVLTSQSGDHAWNVIERDEAKVDLVLTDIVMAGSIDGLTLAAKIRQREAKLPVLFITGSLSEDDAYAAAIAREKLLLRKPFLPKQLVEFIDSHIAQNGLKAAGTRP